MFVCTVSEPPPSRVVEPASKRCSPTPRPAITWPAQRRSHAHKAGHRVSDIRPNPPEPLEYNGIEYAALPVNYRILHQMNQTPIPPVPQQFCLSIEMSMGARDPRRSAARHQDGASRHD
jgi:hypothetical protein